MKVRTVSLLTLAFSLVCLAAFIAGSPHIPPLPASSHELVRSLPAQRSLSRQAIANPRWYASDRRPLP